MLLQKDSKEKKINISILVLLAILVDLFKGAFIA